MIEALHVNMGRCCKYFGFEYANGEATVNTKLQVSTLYRMGSCIFLKVEGAVASAKQIVFEIYIRQYREKKEKGEIASCCSIFK